MSRNSTASHMTGVQRVTAGPRPRTGVSAARIDAAMRRLQANPVVAGQVVIREGEQADRFYIVQAGEFSVTQLDTEGELQTLRALGPDSVFGELGRLTAAPRSATVTAISDGVLLVLEGADFHELVGGPGARHGRLLGLYGSSPGLNVR